MLLTAKESRHTAGSIPRFVATALTAIALLAAAPALVVAQDSEMREGETSETQAPETQAPETQASEAQDSAGEAGEVAIELNKLEPKGADCRAFFLIDNKSDRAYDKLQMEFFVFRPDGIIDQSFAVDLAPLKAKKRTVKRFDISNTSCDSVGSFLINDVTKCQVGADELSDCLEALTVSSRTESTLSK